MKAKNFLKKAICLIILFHLNNFSYSQNVGVNSTGTTPNASSVLDLNTGNTFTSPNGKGLIIPNVALTATSDAITVNTPFTSLLVYNTATAGAGSTAVTPGFYYWDGTKWVAFGGNGGRDWALLGNAGTTAGTNFIGTTDAVDVVFKANNTEWMRLTSAGHLAIGSTTAGSMLKIVQQSNTYASGALIYGSGAVNGQYLALSTLAAQQASIQSGDATTWQNLLLNPSGGNVGVGTTTPAYPFHVYSSQNGTAYMGIENPNAGASALAASITKSNAGMAGFWIASTAAGAYAEYGTTSSGGMYYTVYNASGDHAWRTTAVAAERMRLTSAGDLGIGTNAPGAKTDIVFTSTSGGLRVTGPATSVTNGMLQIRDNDNGAAIAWPGGAHIAIWPSGNGLGIMRFQKSGISQWQFVDRSTVNTNAGRIFALNDANGGGDVITCLGSGNVGIAQSAPGFKLDVTGTGRFTSDLRADTKVAFNSDPTNYYIGQGIGNGIIVQTWDEVRYLFNGGGSSISFKNGALGIGTNTPTQALHVVGNICYTGGIGACSDVRYKKDFTPLTNSLERVLKINGLNYFWKTEEFPEQKFTTDKQIGFIAQDLEKIYPELVTTDKNGYKSVDYSRLTPILVEAIKEQQKIIESQQAVIANLQAENKTMNTQIAGHENRLKALEEILNASAQK